MSSLYAKMLSPHSDLNHPYDNERDDEWAMEAARDLEADLRLVAAEFRDRLRDVWEKRDCGRVADPPAWDALGNLILDDLQANVFWHVFEALGREE